MKRGSKRRAKGEGTFEWLPSGLVRLVKSKAGQDLKGPAAATRTEAEAAWKAKFEGATASGGPSSSFTTSARNWLSSRKNLEATTRETYRFWLQAVESDPLGSQLIAGITDRDLRAWWERQTTKPETRRKRLAWIRQILRAAGNPADYRPPKRQRGPRRPLSPEEVAKLREAMEQASENDRLIVLIALELGLRRSEIAGLRHEDREGDGVRIRATAIQTTGVVRMRPKGKTHASLAWVPLSPKLRELIGPPRKGFVIGGEKPVTPKTVTYAVQRVFRAAGIVVPYGGPHALRRTYGMSLLEAGVDVVTAAELMRHDAGMLLAEYARSRTDLKIAGVEKAFGGHNPHDNHHEQGA